MRKKGEEGMSESNHPEAQIIGALKQVEDVYGKEGDRSTRYTFRKANCGPMGVTG